jgi:diguanylate cyclase (GGDEF)-like protein
MRTRIGVVKQRAFHAFSSLAGTIRDNWNIVVPCLLAALSLSVLSWGFLLGGVASEQKEEQRDSLNLSLTMARAYSVQVARAISAHDVVLRQVRYGWQLSKEGLRLESAEAAEMFRDATFTNLAIIDRNGSLLTAMRPKDLPANAAQEPYFRIHSGASLDRLVIGQVEDGAGKVVALQFSRAIRAGDGRFDGIVLLQAATDDMTTNFFLRPLPRHGLAGLARSDGRLLIAAADPHIAMTVDLPPLAEPDGRSHLAGDRFGDGRPRYLGWHQAGEYPIIAFVGLDEETAMAPFQAARNAAIDRARAATAAIFVVAAVVMGFLLQLTRRKRQSQRTHETYRMATEGSSDGFFILGTLLNGAGSVDDFEVLDCNEHGASLCHQRRETLVGRRFSGLYRDQTFATVMEALHIAVDTGSYDGELECQPEGTEGSRWMRLKAVRSGRKLAITLRDISESKAHVAALEHRGNHDSLTGLPNRHWLQWYLPRAIARAREHRQTLALLFIDLDGFKAANDAMGHAAGDELLRHAAHRLKEAVRPHDNVVRFGGDEFVVILENNLRIEDAAIVAKRVIQAFKPKFKLMGGTALLGTSIGISSFPGDGEDAAALLQNADMAMYSVKTSGKGSFRFFDPEFYEALRKELEYERELRAAIEHDQFVIHYQPRMDLASNRSTSMEALVRWMHPQRGLLEPNEFIALAEKTGMIVRLGELVLAKVCQQLAQWVSREEAMVPVSVNISPRQFNDTNIARIFSSTMARHNIPANLLEIELTESSMMGGSSHVLESLARIRALGIKLLVDDFGTGYSSLAQLQLLDFDVLKVDKAFTSRIEQTEQGRILFTAIITMAHALGMRVVAEGVETASQLAILRALDCDEVQGYYIAFPQAAAEVQSLLLSPACH